MHLPQIRQPIGERKCLRYLKEYRARLGDIRGARPGACQPKEHTGSYGGVAQSGLVHRSRKPEARKGPWVRIPPPPPQPCQSGVMNRLNQSDTLANTCQTVRVGVSNRLKCVAQIWLRGDGIKSRYSVGNPNPTAHSPNNLASLCHSSKLKPQDF